MKTGLKNYTSWLAIIIAALITGYFILIVISWETGVSVDLAYRLDSSSGFNTPSEDTAFGGIFATNNIDPSLPYFQYKKVEDSLNEIKRKRDYINASKGGYGRGFGYLGLAALPFNSYPFPEVTDNADQKALHDSIDILSRTYDPPNSAQIMQRMGLLLKKISQIKQARIDSLIAVQKKTHIYYLTLSGFTLDQLSSFFIANNSYNLAYIKWDIQNGKKGDGHYERKQIPVRYNLDEKKVMIPISKKQYDTIDLLLRFLPFIFIFLGVYIFIGIPLQVIINISKGKAFIPKNILYLRLVSFALLIIVLLNIFLPYLINYFFRADIPSDFEFRKNAYNDPTSYLSQIFIAIGLFIVSLAFQRGYKLQQEQELTI